MDTVFTAAKLVGFIWCVWAAWIAWFNWRDDHSEAPDGFREFK